MDINFPQITYHMFSLSEYLQLYSNCTILSNFTCANSLTLRNIFLKYSHNFLHIRRKPTWFLRGQPVIFTKFFGNFHQNFSRPYSVPNTNAPRICSIRGAFVQFVSAAFFQAGRQFIFFFKLWKPGLFLNKQRCEKHPCANRKIKSNQSPQRKGNTEQLLGEKHSEHGVKSKFRSTRGAWQRYKRSQVQYKRLGGDNRKYRSIR